MMNFAVNTVLEWTSDTQDGQSRFTRILWINPSENSVVIYDMDDKTAVPEFVQHEYLLQCIKDGCVRPVTYTISSILLTEAEISEKYIKRRDKAWAVIKEIVTGDNEAAIYDETYRWKLVMDLNHRTGVSRPQIYTWLRRYWRGGKTPNALLPHYNNCGGKGKKRTNSTTKSGRRSLRARANPELQGISITTDIEEVFRQSVDLWYHTTNKLPFTKVHEEMIKRYFVQGYQEHESGKRVPILNLQEDRPTLRQFRYWYLKERDIEKELKSRLGSRRFNLTHREVTGNTNRESFGPGSVFQIDATIGDIWLVHRYNREWLIGRPIIYLVVDHFSRLIAGMSVSLEGPSWLGAMMALENTASNKVEYCASHGIAIEESEWPSKYLPEQITADRGEMLSPKADNLVNALGVDVINLPAYRPDMKPVIESRFRMINNHSIKWVPGSIRERLIERGQRDYYFDAVLDLEEFERLMIHSVLKYNNFHAISTYQRDKNMIRDDVHPIPLDLWNWGVRRSGILRSVPKDILRLNLLPTATASVSHKGIMFGTRAYTCETAVKKQWFVRGGSNPRSLDINYDPRNNDFIYIRSDNGRSYEVGHLLDPYSRYRGIRDEEARDIDSYESMVLGELSADEVQKEVEYDVEKEKIIAGAMRKRKEEKTRKLKKEDVKLHRKEERENFRRENAWVPGELEHPESSKVIHFPTDTKEDDISIAGADYSDLILSATGLDEEGNDK